MRIRFFAVNRTQQRYFLQLKEHLTCSSDVRLCKQLLRPRLALFQIDSHTLIEHKIKELRNSGSFWGYGIGHYLMCAILHVEITLMVLRYAHYVDDPRYDTIALWNGKHLRQALLAQLASHFGKQTLFFENGMLPDTTVCDIKGVNADNSVPRERAFFETFTCNVKRPLPEALSVRHSKSGRSQSDNGAWLPENFMFIPFQVNHDTQITHHSPWIEDMFAFFELCKAMAKALPRQNFILKIHPSDPADYTSLLTRADNLPNLTFANAVPTQELIERCEGVATINSSVGIEAMLYHKPVIVLGEAFYAIEGITQTIRSKAELLALLERSIDTPNATLRQNFLDYLNSEYLIPAHWKNPTKAHYDALNQRLTCKASRKECVLFMVSTTLHLYNAIVAAMMHDEWESHLVYIDQAPQEHHLYFEALQAWETSPFQSLSLYPTRVKGALNKWRVRRNAFKRLRRDVGAIAPQRIYVGNDRRIEFAYALHVAKQIQPDVIGGYIDDGAYSYIVQKSKWYQDTFIDITFKKLIYGFWYFRPSIIAASDAVQEAFVALPEFVHEKLKTKTLHRLETDRLLDTRLKPFTDYIVSPYHLDTKAIKALDLLFILPHESLIRSAPDFMNSVLQSIKQSVAQGYSVGIKYHPRQSERDPLGLLEYKGVSLLPNTLAFEALLPLLGSPIIVGDVSSALLMARWLRSDLKVLSLRKPNDARQKEMRAIFEYVGITIVEPSHFQTTLAKELAR